MCWWPHLHYYSFSTLSRSIETWSNSFSSENIKTITKQNNKKYPWSIAAIWKFFENGQHYLAQSVSILSINKLKHAFSLKTDKGLDVNEINYNVIKSCFGELSGPLKYLFHSSLESEVFPDLMKIALVSPVFKTGGTPDISNYRPIYRSSSLFFKNPWTHNVQFPIQILIWLENITPTTVWL